jgi:two-component system, cell cycle sensor histidine kinase and response regulator CckA
MRDHHKTNKRFGHDVEALRSQHADLKESITGNVLAGLAAEEARRYAESIVEADKAEPSQRRGETILIVEDDVSVLYLTERILDHLGYVVLTSESPVEALTMGREYQNEIHILMTDVVLPEMSGRDLAGEILKIRPNIKTMFMSGYTADIIAYQRVLEKGVHFIHKPFTFNSLARKVRVAMDSEK